MPSMSSELSEGRISKLPEIASVSVLPESLHKTWVSASKSFVVPYHSLVGTDLVLGIT